nr:carboxypeptidase-like regulatory domain-containing protein [Chitinophagaceae bacterium]
MKTIDFNKYITKITRGFNSKFALLSLFFLYTLSINAQENSITISGTVISQDDKQPLPGSTVTIKNTTIGTSTDVSGKFELNTDKPLPLTLVVTVLGFQTQEVVIRNAKQSSLLVSLIADNK